jgi:hypothetical protein
MIDDFRARITRDDIEEALAAALHAQNAARGWEVPQPVSQRLVVFFARRNVLVYAR